MKHYCNPLNENSTLNMDNGGRGCQSLHEPNEETPNVEATSKVHPTKREKFERLVVEILVASGNTPLQEKKADKLYDWHIDEMKKLLESVENCLVGGSEDVDWDKFNKLMEEYK